MADRSDTLHNDSPPLKRDAQPNYSPLDYGEKLSLESSRNNDMAPFKNELAPPQDKFFLAYGIFFIQGVAMLLPWNVFITASEYFSAAFKGGRFAGNFQNYFSVSFTLLNLIFVCVAMALQHKANFPMQIIVSHTLNMIIFIMVIVMINISNIAPDTYFGIILALMTLTGITSSYLQNALYELGARLPPIYVQGFLTGQVSYVIMRRLPIYRYYNQNDQKLGGQTTVVLQNYTRADTLYIARLLWKYGMAVLMTLFVTLALFPSITASITSNHPDNARWQSREIFVLLHFTIFNAGDMLGKMLPAIIPVKNDRALLILSTLRMVFAPLFVLSNVQYGAGDILARSTPVIFGDAAYYAILSVFSVSNGWIGTCVMMFGPEKVAEKDRGYSGMMLSVLMTLGLAIGSLASFAVRAGICNCNSFME
ncbi:nucleoside transporter-domain-containing protein [Syncephalis fuscata]|nr:nucleoside transporter-domain-containing protein [Syncephalis fuscata]